MSPVTYYDRYLDTYWTRTSRGSGGYQGFHSLGGWKVRVQPSRGDMVPVTWKLLDKYDVDPFNECMECGRRYEE